jgi:hypothetical protein
MRQGFKPLSDYRFDLKLTLLGILECPYNIILGRETAVPISVNLTLNPVRDCCLTIKLRSPLAPLKKGGTGIFSKSPFLRGMRGGSRLG